VRTLSVFEHSTLHVRARSGSFNALAPTLTPAQFDALARFNGCHGDRYFHLGHRRLTFRSYVGYLQVGTLGIEILPKIARHAAEVRSQTHWQNLLLEMLRVSASLPLHSPTSTLRGAGRPTLFELVAVRFTEELERLLHEGLAKGYREIEANGSTFRGRLLSERHVRSNFARADRFFVRFSTFDRDIGINRILAAAARALSQAALAPALQARIAASALCLPDGATTGVGPEDCDRIVLARNTVRYRDALTLARLILAQRAPELRAGEHSVFAVLFDMNALWEHYVGWLFRRAVPSHWDVALQESCNLWQERPARARRVRPDIVLRDRASGRNLLVVDAKWKAAGDGAPADDDLKQMFVYNHLFGTDQSILVYPSAGAGWQALAGEFFDRRHRCGSLGVGLFDGLLPRPEGMVSQVRDLLALLGSGAGTAGPRW